MTQSRGSLSLLQGLEWISSLVGCSLAIPSARSRASWCIKHPMFRLWRLLSFARTLKAQDQVRPLKPNPPARLIKGGTCLLKVPVIRTKFEAFQTRFSNELAQRLPVQRSIKGTAFRFWQDRKRCRYCNLQRES